MARSSISQAHSGAYNLLRVASYVPLHELLRAVACLAVGGAGSRLEIDPL
jgi:hypothetical protein